MDWEKEALNRGVDLRKLKQEQSKLAKSISLKDSINFELAERIAGIESVYFKNMIISAIVVFENQEIIEQEYFSDRISFPYIPGFLAYRELPSMLSAFNKLDEKPDIVFVRGHGIAHPRECGIASHFSLVANVPAIGIADSLLAGEVRDGDIILNGKIVGKVLQTKQGANPIYVSPGNKISVETAVRLVKKFTKEPHKVSEPLRLARRYAKEIRKEIMQI